MRRTFFPVQAVVRGRGLRASAVAVSAALLGVGLTAVVTVATTSPARADTSSVVEGWGTVPDVPNGQSELPALNAQLPPGATATALSTDGSDAYALTSGGSILAWGADDSGQLGDGTTSPSGSSTPVQVQLPSGDAVATSVAAGDGNAIALTSSGSVYAWGHNGSDSLAESNPPGDLDVPVQVSLPVPAVSVALSASNGYAVGTDGNVYAWGSNAHGALGNGTSDGPDDPDPGLVSTPPGETFTSVAASDSNAAWALTSSGSVYAWGNGTSGMLGDGDTSDSATPVPVCAPGASAPCGADVLADVTAIGAGAAHGLALTSSGDVDGWGSNDDGQLGDGTDQDRSVPVQASLGDGVTATAIAAADGGNHSLALTSSGAIFAWGDNSDGQLGNGTAAPGGSATPAEVSFGVSGATASLIAAGNGASLADVNRGAQAVTFDSTPPSTATFGGAGYTVTASAPSTSPVVLTVDPTASSVCSLSGSDSGSTVSFIGVGTCTIDANADSDADYDPAAQVQQSFTVAKASQSVSFTSTPPTDATYNGPTYRPSAGSTSGLPVTITVDPSTTSVCSISSGVVSFIGHGPCILDANQAGNADYLAASQVQQSFAVAAITILTQSLPGATRGSPYSVQMQAQGAKTPYQWRKASGSLPKGLKLAKSGRISGTPSVKKQPGTFSVTIEVEDASKPKLTATKRYTLVLS